LNPPYGRVKFLASTLTNEETLARDGIAADQSFVEQVREEVAGEAHRFREISRSIGLGGGEQNLQRIFIALCHRSLAPDGYMSVIAPSAWLGDRDGYELRRSLVSRRCIDGVTLYREDSGLFATVNQVTAVVSLTPPSSRSSIEVDLRNGASHPYLVGYDDIYTTDPERLRIPKLDRERFAVLQRLQSNTRISEFPDIKNARGELDQTACKEFIQDSGRSRLIRGDHLERFVLRPPAYSERPSFVAK
ncbi:uncharacterized protein METZ01_LOCUS471002, partial [marine metagenome]